MKRKFRLQKSSDFKRVRRFGKTYAHPFVVLIKRPNDHSITRFGVVAGRSVGNAVKRNRAKRRLREILRPRIKQIADGWDILLLARKSIHDASYDELQQALDVLIMKANLLKDEYAP
jgi:ribonuclease P protein component